MWPTFTPCVVLIIILFARVHCDYECVCNYAVETSVYSVPDTSGSPIGYLYEFDCKPESSVNQSPDEYYAVQFEKQLGYLKKNDQMQIQSCPGSPPDSDLVPTVAAPVTSGVPATSAATTATTVLTTTAATSTATTTTPILVASTSTTVRSSTTTTTVPKATTLSSLFISANVTGTPYEFIGTGYNLLTGNPESRPDPGLMAGGRIFQLTGDGNSVNEATYVRSPNCTQSDSRFALYGSKQYQKELTSLVDTSQSHMTQVKDSAFVFSPDFQAMKPSLENTSVIYLDFISSCKEGTAHYLGETATEGGFHVTREFARDICALPTDLNSTIEYMRFLDKWGTSIVTSVTMGTRQIDRYQTTPSQIFNHVQQTEPHLIEHTGAYQGYSSSVTINTKDYITSPAGSAKFGSHVTLGSSTDVVPIGMKVVPIYNALNWSYWQPVIDELTAEGVCPDSVYGTGMQHYARNFKTIMMQYPEYMAPEFVHTALTDHNLVMPITWPAGTYGLMQASSGCPGNQTHWATGWRLQDTEDLYGDNKFTNGINHYMKGEFASSNIKTYFCMKTTERTSGLNQAWPNGTYCILKYHSCPTGFTSGYIHWDDEDLGNDNSKGGTLPDGSYDSNTRIYYCCRNDASPQTTILLPTDRPFLLVRYGRTCQAVIGMHVHDLFVQWDDEDLRNKDKNGGMHPLDDGNSHNHKLHFCYYSSSSTNSPTLIG